MELELSCGTASLANKHSNVLRLLPDEFDIDPLQVLPDRPTNITRDGAIMGNETSYWDGLNIRTIVAQTVYTAIPFVTGSVPSSC